jgi:peptidoglycan hydrolase CwlO-like protein
MEIAVFVISLIIGVYFLRLAFLNFGKEKYPTSTLFAMVAAFFILCSFPWFQGFIKTWIISNANAKFAALGKQLDTVQKTTGDMHDELANHQKQIDEHQKELDTVQGKIRKTQSEVADSQTDITNQFQHLTSLENELATAQTNLQAQQTKLQDVDYWIQNYTDRLTNEVFTLSDTLNTYVVPTTDGSLPIVLRLSHVPIAKSVRTKIISSESLNVPRELYGGDVLYDNIMLACMIYGYNSNLVQLTVEYVIDTRNTNVYQTIPNKESIKVAPGTRTVTFHKPKF